MPAGRREPLDPLPGCFCDRDWADVYAQVQQLALVTDLGDLERKHAQATAWATALLGHLRSE